MTVGERIKTIRKALGLNQTDFGEKIGFKQSLIGQMENGSRNVLDRTILLICEKYGVSEQWLRTGKGEMFTECESTIVSQLAVELDLDIYEKSMLTSFLKLNTWQRQVISKFIKDAMQEAIKNETARKELLDSHNLETNVVKPQFSIIKSESDRDVWEQEADEFAAMARAQFLQEKKRESQASSAPQSDAG